MMTRILMTCALGLLLSVVGMAQRTIDVVRLKDGTVIKGVIIEQVEGLFIRVQLTDGRVEVLQASDVAEITKEQVQGDGNLKKWRAKKGAAFARTGFVNHTALGLGFGVGNKMVETSTSLGSSYPAQYKNEERYVRLETVNGWWLFNGLFSMGVGLGLEYTSWVVNWLQMPVFADVRLLPLSGAVTPVVILQGGYSVGLTENVEMDAHRNGPQLSVGLGLHSSKRKHFAMNLGLLYDWHRYRTERSTYHDPAITITEVTSLGYLRLCGGVTF